MLPTHFYHRKLTALLRHHTPSPSNPSKSENSPWLFWPQPKKKYGKYFYCLPFFTETLAPATLDFHLNLRTATKTSAAVTYSPPDSVVAPITSPDFTFLVPNLGFLQAPLYLHAAFTREITLRPHGLNSPRLEMLKEMKQGEVPVR
ncbi:hypothetical protein U1Q18_020872 [Sarracenia purpurea var. burkii]